MFSISSNLFAQKKIVTRYFTAFEVEGFLITSGGNDMIDNSNQVLGGNVQLMLETTEKFAMGLSIGILNLSYSLNANNDLPVKKNLNYTYLPISFNIRDYNSKKILESRFYLAGEIKYCLTLNGTEIQDNEYSLTDILMTSVGVGLSIPTNTASSFDITTQFGFMAYGLKMKDPDIESETNTEFQSSFFLKIGAIYRFQL